jgi:hypothetical protein
VKVVCVIHIELRKAKQAADAMRISKADGEVLLGVYLRKLQYTKYDLDTNNLNFNQFFI